LPVGKGQARLRANDPCRRVPFPVQWHGSGTLLGEALLGDLVGLITKHLKKGERIRIAGFGILQVRKRAARMGRNPATGEAIKIKASKKVAFRAAKELKLAV
jgi:nucleoid DNA-binding protein